MKYTTHAHTLVRNFQCELHQILSEFRIVLFYLICFLRTGERIHTHTHIYTSVCHMKTLKMHENRNNNMESFYEENQQYVVPTTQSRTQRNLKRPESLDLNLAANNNKQPGGKKARCNQIPAVLASPDLNMLKWGTPDLEKFIMSSDPLQTPTPSLMYPNLPNPIIKVTFFCFFFYLSFRLLNWCSFVVI